MKRCKNITGWTDYPMISLGDTGGQLAPIRHVKVIAFDRNKYATVKTDDGHIESIKAGYLYRNKSRYKTAKLISFAKLSRGIYEVKHD